MNEIFVVPIPPFSSVEDHEFGPQKLDEKQEISFQGKWQNSEDQNRSLVVKGQKLSKMPQMGRQDPPPTLMVPSSKLHSNSQSTGTPSPSQSTTPLEETSSQSTAAPGALKELSPEKKNLSSKKGTETSRCQLKLGNAHQRSKGTETGNYTKKLPRQFGVAQGQFRRPQNSNQWILITSEFF
eukprot:GHVP01007656.1.p1 GENE.GHVP01007656.1~~GHVP01007656.1.p1  ORF type:complete len:189 (-),score=44.81 GHVP01007656.1:49-594(-)